MFKYEKFYKSVQKPFCKKKRYVCKGKRVCIEHILMSKDMEDILYVSYLLNTIP